MKVHYHGTLTDGTVFDSSVKRGEPATFPLNQVIKCWTEAVQLIKVGGKSRLVCPRELPMVTAGHLPSLNQAPRWYSKWSSWISSSSNRDSYRTAPGSTRPGEVLRTSFSSPHKYSLSVRNTVVACVMAHKVSFNQIEHRGNGNRVLSVVHVTTNLQVRAV